MGEHRDIGVDLAVIEIAHPLVERRDLGEHPLDPAFDQGRLRPAGPGAADLAVVHREVGIAHQHGGVADRGGWRATNEDRAAQVAIGLEPSASARLGVDVVGSDGRVRAVGREAVAPLKFIQLRLARVVAAVAQRHLLVERVARQQYLEISFVEAGIDLEDLHGDGIPRVGEGLAIFEHEHHIAGALARRAQCVAVHRRVAVADVGDGRLVDHARVLGRIDHIIAGHRCAFAEGFQLGVERIDRSIPFALVAAVAAWAKGLQFRQIRRAQHIQIEVVLTRDFIDKLPFEDEATLGA